MLWTVKVKNFRNREHTFTYSNQWFYDREPCTLYLSELGTDTISSKVTLSTPSQSLCTILCHFDSDVSCQHFQRMYNATSGQNLRLGAQEVLTGVITRPLLMHCLKEKVNSLAGSVNNGSNFVILTGPKGIGKSSLCALVARENNWRYANLLEQIGSTMQPADVLPLRTELLSPSHQSEVAFAPSLTVAGTGLALGSIKSTKISGGQSSTTTRPTWREYFAVLVAQKGDEPWVIDVEHLSARPDFIELIRHLACQPGKFLLCTSDSTIELRKALPNASALFMPIMYEDDLRTELPAHLNDNLLMGKTLRNAIELGRCTLQNLQTLRAAQTRSAMPDLVSRLAAFPYPANDTKVREWLSCLNFDLPTLQEPPLHLPFEILLDYHIVAQAAPAGDISGQAAYVIGDPLLQHQWEECIDYLLQEWRTAVENKAAPLVHTHLLATLVQSQAAQAQTQTALVQAQAAQAQKIEEILALLQGKSI
eukprot:TRINITY_DN29921_c0_g1_i1.p1 TRINITY_DN29921_c0_g1~~TRINITY_DN29921_c0_g1_i1.p1  ORF type:complete len:486 (-),score=52.00 TRINITY_DN29921_c0_g1_i1:61-1497(-)